MNHSKSDHLIGTLLVLAAIISWGIYFPFAKIVLIKLSPQVFLVFRLGIGALVLLFFSLKSKQKFNFTRSDWLTVSLAGTVGIILHQLIQVAGLKLTTATNIGWILTLIPPVTGILGWIFLKEAIAPRQAFGLIVAIAGVLLFVSKGNLSALSFSGNLGDFLALLSVWTWSSYTILMKPLVKKFEPVIITNLHMALGFFFFLLISVKTIPAQINELNLIEVIILILIGLIPSGLAYFWWAAGLKRLSVINTSTLLFIEAIAASVTAFAVLQESFTLPMLFFAVIIIIGVYITQSQIKISRLKNS